jgi:hypothetical protein
MVSHLSDWPLVVVREPDEGTLESLCDHLTADRFNVLPAPTASDVLREIRQADPDRVRGLEEGARLLSKPASYEELGQGRRRAGGAAHQQGVHLLTAIGIVDRCNTPL